MMSYRQFVFSSYNFDSSTRTLTLRYSFDEAQHFTESYRFDFPFVAYDPAVLDRAVQLLFFMAGVSYYKAFLAPEIVVKEGLIDDSTARFLEKTWQKGLGEYWYINQLDPNTGIEFPVNAPQQQTLQSTGTGGLVGLGGGKDSLVSVELLRKQLPDIATWSLNHRQQLAPLVERIGLQHYWVEREFDMQLVSLKNTPGYRNGHIPISAIFACVGTIVTILAGKRDYIVSNEQSANAPTLSYQGVPINHQYSKSQEFEADYQSILEHNFDESTRYYSLLRPFSELRIGELFAPHFDTYHDVFSSCNRAFTHTSNHMFWDGTCPKCAFVYLILTPFVDRLKLEALFDGKNLLLDPALRPTYRQLLGIEGDKPLDCIGEIEESRAAMRLAFTIYPELASIYDFEMSQSYDFRKEYPHLIPADIIARVTF